MVSRCTQNVQKMYKSQKWMEQNLTRCTYNNLAPANYNCFFSLNLNSCVINKYCLKSMNLLFVEQHNQCLENIPIIQYFLKWVNGLQAMRIIQIEKTRHQLECNPAIMHAINPLVTSSLDELQAASRSTRNNTRLQFTPWKTSCIYVIKTEKNKKNWFLWLRGHKKTIHVQCTSNNSFWIHKPKNINCMFLNVFMLYYLCLCNVMLILEGWSAEET